MLPQSHIAYTWLAASLWQDYMPKLSARLRLDAANRPAPAALDYRLLALAAIGPDLVDKPLAALYFYRRYKSAVLFAHTLLLNLLFTAFWLRNFPQAPSYLGAWLGHAVLDRLWFFPHTFYWPLRGWRFHVWGKRGSEQPEMSMAYWYAFTRRPELWGWEIGGLLALFYFVYRHQLWQRKNLWRFLSRGAL